jgi:RHS repeat-associated protein
MQYIKLLMLLFVLLSIRANAQLSQEGMLKNTLTTDLFDERGFSKNISNTVNSSYSINPVNGNLIYNYLISSTKVNDANLDMTLTFNANTKFTSYGYFDGNINKYKWTTMDINKGCWIIGVNGFAIQTTHVADNYFTDPAIERAIYAAKSTGGSGYYHRLFVALNDCAGQPKSSSNVESYFIDKLNLNIEGYDICNRMCLLTGFDNVNNRDFINILKADGSVLKLTNEKKCTESTSYTCPSNDEELYTGKYYEEGLNTKGYGIVEYLDKECYQTMIDDIKCLQNSFNYHDDFIITENSVHGSGTGNILTSNLEDLLPHLRPRRLRYFPGDGYEYIFTEYPLPFGYTSLLMIPSENLIIHCDESSIDASKNTASENYGGNVAYPTIFYLDAIYHNGVFVTNFTYNRHINNTPIYNPSDKMSFNNQVGRAEVTGFVNHEFEYNYNKITIKRITFDNKLNNKTELFLDVCDKLLYEDINGNENVSRVFSKEGIIGNSCQDKMKKVLSFNLSFLNYTSYVSEIRETQNESEFKSNILFQYNKEYRGFFNIGFPFQGFILNMPYDPLVGTGGDLKYFYAVPNFQLNRIKEPDKLSIFKYYNPITKRKCQNMESISPKYGEICFNIDENILYAEKGYSLEQNLSEQNSLQSMPMKSELTNIVYQSYSGDFEQTYIESMNNDELINIFKSYNKTDYRFSGTYSMQYSVVNNILNNKNQDNNYEQTNTMDIFNYYRIPLWSRGFNWNTQDTNLSIDIETKLLGANTYTFQKSHINSLKINEQNQFRTVKRDEVVSLKNYGNQILTENTLSITYDPYYSKITQNNEPLKILSIERTEYKYDTTIINKFSPTELNYSYGNTVRAFYGTNIKKITQNTKLMNASQTATLKEIENVKEFKSFECFNVDLDESQAFDISLRSLNYFVVSNLCGKLLECMPFSTNSTSPKINSIDKKDDNRLQETELNYQIFRYYAPLLNEVPVKDITYVINRNSTPVSAEIISGKYYELYDCSKNSNCYEVPKRGKIKTDKFAKLNTQLYNATTGISNIDYIEGNRYDYYDFNSYVKYGNVYQINNPIGLIKTTINSNNITSSNTYSLPADIPSSSSNYLVFMNSKNYNNYNNIHYPLYVTLGCYFHINTIGIRNPYLDTISLIKKEFVDAYGNILDSYDNNNNFAKFKYDIFNRNIRITFPGDFHDNIVNYGYLYQYDDRIDLIDIYKSCFTEIKYKKKRFEWYGQEYSTTQATYDTYTEKQNNCFLTNTASFDMGILYFFGLCKESSISSTTPNNYFSTFNENPISSTYDHLADYNTTDPGHYPFDKISSISDAIYDYYVNETGSGNPSVIGYANCGIADHQKISSIDSLYFEFSIDPFKKNDDINMIDNAQFTLDITLTDDNGNSTSIPNSLKNLNNYRSPLFLISKNSVDLADAKFNKQKIVLIPGLLNQIYPAISIPDLISFLNSGKNIQIAIKMVTPGKRIVGNNLSCIIRGIIVDQKNVDESDFTQKTIYNDFQNFSYKPSKIVINKIDDRANSKNFIHNDLTYSRFFRTDYRLGYNYNIEQKKRYDIDYNDDQIYQVQYNLLNQKIKEIDPMGYTSIYSYDELFRLKSLKTSTDNITLQSEVKYLYNSLDNQDIINNVNLKNPYFYTNDNNITTTDIENNIPNFTGSGILTTSIIETISKSEANTTNYIKNYEYKDALGNLRVSIKEASSINRTDIENPIESILSTKKIFYEYDNLNRLIEVTNPANQYIRYWYEDMFGKVKYKYQPDLGFNSYRYDRFGNLRFLQTQQQAVEQKMTFYQYDDLNRMTIVGEATFNNTNQNYLDSTGFIKATIKENNINLNRITDQIEPNYLHYNGNTINSVNTYSNLTVNPTIFSIEPNSPPTDSSYYYKFGLWYNQSMDNKFDNLNKIIGVNCKPYNLITNWNPVINNNTIYSMSNFDNFEDVKSCPQNVLIAYYYDELPSSISSYIFSNFPDKSVWNNLMEEKTSTESPAIKVRKARNLKGRVATIAYREKGDMPFNYLVFSYDERGRVETMLRLTDNIGFDAVYYTYNSMDAVTSVRVVDANKQLATYYGYDNEARIDTIWNSDINQFGGFIASTTTNPEKLFRYNYVNPPNSINKDVSGNPFFSFAYRYNSRDQLDSINIPVNKTSVKNKYNSRGWLTSIDAKTNNETLFEQVNAFSDDNLGNIEKTSYNNNGTQRYFEYVYDEFKEQLTLFDIYDSDYSQNRKSIKSFDNYYDQIGNRQIALEIENNSVTYNQIGYSGNKYFQPNALLSQRLSIDGTDATAKQIIKNQYYSDAALKNKISFDKENSLFQFQFNPNTIDVYKKTIEDFQYDFRGLLNQYTKNSAYINDINDCKNPLPEINKVVWKYAYNPFGERESKRMDYSYKGTANGEVYPCVYYLLGTNNEQYTTYYGVYNKDDVGSISGYSKPSQYNVSNGAVMFYAGEYNIYGPGGQMLSYMLDENGNYNKNYKILDQLGNTHIVLKNSEIIGSYMYEPFGKQITLFTESQTRLSFISKEKDIESSLGDFGVRKYDEVQGRFTSIDPLWEKYYSWTPYHYCSNNPVMGSDPGGLNGEGVLSTGFWTTVYEVSKAIPALSATIPGLLLTPLALGGDSSPTQAKHKPPFNPNLTKDEIDELSGNKLNTKSSNEAGDEQIDWHNPPTPDALGEDWKETTHPKANSPEYTNTKTGEKIRFDPKNTKGEADPHWHRINPNPKLNKNKDEYLDENDNPCAKGSSKSHIKVKRK